MPPGPGLGMMGRISAHIGASKIFSMQHVAHHGQDNENNPAHAAHPAMSLNWLAKSWARSGVHHAHENKGLGLQVDSIWTPETAA